MDVRGKSGMAVAKIGNSGTFFQNSHLGSEQVQISDLKYERVRALVNITLFAIEKCQTKLDTIQFSANFCNDKTIRNLFPPRIEIPC